MPIGRKEMHMANIDTEVKKVVEKIIKGGTEVTLIDSLVVISEMYIHLDDSNYYPMNDSWYRKNFGETLFIDTMEYVKKLQLEFRTELAHEHNLLETFRIYTALSLLKCKVIRVSKSSKNYENVKIARAFTKVGDCVEELPSSLFKPLKLI